MRTAHGGLWNRRDTCRRHVPAGRHDASCPIPGRWLAVRRGFSLRSRWGHSVVTPNVESSLSVVSLNVAAGHDIGRTATLLPNLVW